MNMNQQGGVATGAQRPNAGVDVSKQYLDVCCGELSQRWANDAHGWDELTAILRRVQADLVVLEATGGYERGVVCALQEAGLAVARVNPRQARDFAKSMGVLAKTDQVDARLLRDFADVLARHPSRQQYITPLVEAARQELAELMVRHRHAGGGAEPARARRQERGAEHHRRVAVPGQAVGRDRRAHR